MAIALQERPLGVLLSNTVTNPRVKLIAITTMDGLTLDGSFVPHSNFTVYQEEEQEPETITEVVEILSSQSTPLVPPPKLHYYPHQNQRKTLSLILISHQFHIHLGFKKINFKLWRFLRESDVDPQKEKSSGSTTSHSDHSLPEYGSFYFDVDLKEFEDLSYHGPSIDPPPIGEKDNDSALSKEFSETGHLVSFPFGNEDEIFNPVILIINGVHSKKSPILLLNVLSPISSGIDLLSPKDSFEIEPLLSFPSGNEDKVFNPGILMVYEFHTFMRKSSSLHNVNFKIVKRQILNEISLKIESLICFHPKDKGTRGESS
ncbi:hypothetical protein Tco_1283890 [Tanacetum coccineum]